MIVEFAGNTTTKAVDFYTFAKNMDGKMRAPGLQVSEVSVIIVDSSAMLSASLTP